MTLSKSPVPQFPHVYMGIKVSHLSGLTILVKYLTEDHSKAGHMSLCVPRPLLSRGALSLALMAVFVEL